MEEKCKVLILGGKGMLGHMLGSVLRSSTALISLSTVRTKDDPDSVYFDALKDIGEIHNIIEDFKPNYIINCIGQLVDASIADPSSSIYINSYLPHYLSKAIQGKHEMKLIHISTDCVFNGKNGPYQENSTKNETNYYGLSKNLGELSGIDNCMTIRTSIIGPEIRRNKSGLFNWVLSNNNREIKGFENVIWSGLTTLELSRYILNIIQNNNFKSKEIVHATNNSGISKYELIKLISEIYDLNISIEKDFKKKSNKQLINNKDLKYNFCSYEEMLIDLRNWTSNDDY